jgi:hypothetical protein
MVAGSDRILFLGKLGNAGHTFLSTDWTSTVVRGLE